MEEGWGLVVKLVGLYLVLIILNSFFQYRSRIYEWIVSKKFFIAIKGDLFIRIASLNNSKFKEKKPSDYLSIFNNNVEVIYEDYISASIDIFKSFINIIVFASALLLFVDWRITIVVLGTSIIAAFIPKIMQRELSKRRKTQLFKLRAYFGKVLDLLSGKKRINRYTVNAFVNEHLSSLIDSEENRLYFGKYKTISDMLNAMGVFLIQITTFAVVAGLLVEGEISVGTGIAAFGYVTSFLTPIKNILDCINCINSAKETVKETLEYLDHEILEETNITNTDSGVNCLTLQDVSYKVENFQLAPFTYEFEKGKRYAIIGHSGSGKSTIMHLIDGSIEPSTGKILIDGRDVKHLNREEFIFSIDQFEHLFQTDFLNNITVYNSMKDHNQLASQLLDKLSITTKEKITSYEQVEQLSGGEKQILGLLRMLIANRPIILIDESFSSIDQKNMQIIKDYIMTLEDKIIIEVTHDVSHENLSAYDDIISFDEGKRDKYILNCQRI